MKVIGLGLALALGFGAAHARAADGCQQVVAKLELPVKIKTKGKPKRLRWGDVNQVVHQVRKAAEGHSCRLTFGEVFLPKTKKGEVYFPLLDSVLRTAPEEELVDVMVYYVDGAEEAGRFSNRVVFEKSSYTQYYFQFKGADGDLRTANKNLIDIGQNAPMYMIPWAEIKDRALIGAGGGR